MIPATSTAAIFGRLTPFAPALFQSQAAAAGRQPPGAHAAMSHPLLPLHEASCPFCRILRFPDYLTHCNKHFICHLIP